MVRVAEPSEHSTPSLGERVRADVDRYRSYAPGVSTLKILLDRQGLWAIIEFRFGNWVKGRPPRARGRALLRPLAWLSHKVIEMTTGISIAHSAKVGKGLYVGHFGGIVIGGDVVMGERCNVGQGVTIGVDGQGLARGSPRIGDGVHVAPGAKVFGRIEIGSHTRIGANAVVNRDVPSRVLAAGVPAKILREYPVPGDEPQ